MKTNVASNICTTGRCTFLLAACLMLASCQTTTTRVATESRQVDPNDPCGPIRSQLGGTQDHFSANITGGAVIGAIAGLLTSIQSGDRKKILTHTIVGGLAGAAAGYLKGKIQQGQSREDLRQAIDSDVQRDTRKVTEMGAILGRLNECRRVQVAAIKRGFDDGHSTAEHTRGELKTVRAGIERDNTLIEEILGEVTKRKGVYVASIGQVEEQTEEQVLGDVAEYTPETAAPTTVATGSSTIDVSTRPTPENDVQRLELASLEINAVYEADNADLFREIDEMEELTLI